MKTYVCRYRSILFTITTFFLIMVGCKEESPFKGRDNRLISLSLTVEGKEYKGIIRGDSVNIFIPPTTDMNNAKATFVISENAKIMPNPEKITDWNNDQVFNVISFNNEKRTYNVKIQKISENIDGSVILRTDADVKNFSKKNATVVGGNLVIGSTSGKDSIHNIDALTSLEKVQYNIVVNPTYKGKDLSGLRNIKEIGSLIITENPSMEDATMKSLQKVNRDISVKNNKKLVKMRFPKLRLIQKILTIKTPVLTETDFSNLISVGEIMITSESIGSLDMNKLEKVEHKIFIEGAILEQLNLSSLKDVGGPVEISSAPKLSILKTNNLTSINGDLIITNTAVGSALFPKLKKVESVTFDANTLMTTISMKQLQSVSGIFQLSNLSIRSLNGLDLKRANELNLRGLPFLSDIGSFFNNLDSVPTIKINGILTRGIIDISKSNAKNVELVRCSNITILKLPKKLANVTIGGDPQYAAKTVTSISGVKEAGFIKYADVKSDNPTTISLGDLETVQTLNFSTGGVSKLFAPQLKSSVALHISKINEVNNSKFKGIQHLDFPELQKVSFFDIIKYPDLETCNFPKLKEIGTLSLTIEDTKTFNTTLTNLNGFSALSRINKVEIKRYKALTDYSCFKRVVDNGNLTPKKWEINKESENGYNPTFEDLKAGRYVKP